MADLNFPSTPANGQTYTSGGVTWIYNSARSVWGSTNLVENVQYAWTNTHTFAANVTFDTDTMFVDATNNRVGIGTTAPAAKLQIEGADETLSGIQIGGNWSNGIYDYAQGIMLHSNSSAGAYGMSTFRWVNTPSAADQYFIKSRGDQVGNNAIVQNGDGLAWIAATGANGSASYNRDSAVISMYVDGTPSGVSVPGAISFWTAAAGDQWTSARMQISANGNVGIGATAPEGKLDVYSSGWPGIRHIIAEGNYSSIYQKGSVWPELELEAVSNTSTAGIHFKRTRGTYATNANTQTNDLIGFIFFAGENANTTEQNGRTADIASYQTGAVQSSGIPGILAFSTSDGSNTYPAERMRIAANGNIGIGTTDPLYHVTINNTFNDDGLYIIGGDYPELRISSSGANTPWYGSGITFDRSTGTYASPANSQTNDYLGYIWGRGYITGTGYRPGAEIDFLQESSITGSYVPTYISISTSDGVAGLQERIKIAANGNVGIGTTAPATKLSISSDSIQITTAKTPASATATGTTGQICWDSSYIYVCTGTNTWRRVAHSSW